MATITAVADALEDKLNDITGLRVYDYVPESVNVPCIVLSLGEIERGTMNRGVMHLPWEAVILISRGSDRTGQKKLYEYADSSTAGANSVWAQIDENNSLGLADTDAKVLRYRPLGIEEIAAYGYFGGVFDILVITSGA